MEHIQFANSDLYIVIQLIYIFFISVLFFFAFFFGRNDVAANTCVRIAVYFILFLFFRKRRKQFQSDFVYFKNAGMKLCRNITNISQALFQF